MIKKIWREIQFEQHSALRKNAVHVIELFCLFIILLAHYFDESEMSAFFIFILITLACIFVSLEKESLKEGIINLLDQIAEQEAHFRIRRSKSDMAGIEGKKISSILSRALQQQRPSEQSWVPVDHMSEEEIFSSWIRDGRPWIRILEM